MIKKFLTSVIIAASVFLNGCSSEEVPPGFKGKMLDKTGPFALYTGGKGFTGDVLNSGVYYTGIYNEVKLLECAEWTRKEKLFSLTKDGVQFGTDIYIKSQPNCDDSKAVNWIFNNIRPYDESDKSSQVIKSRQLYDTYIMPILHNAMREAVAKQTASDMNTNREEVSKVFEDKFRIMLRNNGGKPVVITVSEISISNFNFPKELEEANSNLALQPVLTKLAIQNREKIEQETKTEQAKVKAQTETEQLKIELEKTWAEAKTQHMKIIAKTIRDNPEYLKYDMQEKLPELYKALGQNGNIIMVDPKSVPGFMMPIQQTNKESK